MKFNEKSEKTKRKLNIPGLMILTVILVTITSISMAKYKSSFNKDTDVMSAKWGFKVYIDDNDEVVSEDGTFVINLADTIENNSDDLENGKIAPGSYGNFDINVEGQNAETGIEYVTVFENITENFPENIKFYTSPLYLESEQINFGVQQINYISLEDIEQIQTQAIYWIWEKDDAEETNQKDMSNSGRDILINIKVTGTQFVDEIIEKETDQKYFQIDENGRLSLNPDFKNEFSAEVTKLVIPQKIGETEVKTIEENAFMGYKNIISLYVPEKIENIERSAFQDCSNLKKITVGKDIQVIGTNAFYNCINLKRVNLKEGLLRIEKWAFDNCSSITNIKIPNTVNYIGESAFYNCINLEQVNIPDNITIINEWTFWNCAKLRKVIIPENVTKISEGAFGKCILLEEVIIGKKVETIGDSSFYMNENLKSVVIPSNVLTIENLAFGGCIELKDITVSENTNINETAFYRCPISE